MRRFLRGAITLLVMVGLAALVILFISQSGQAPIGGDGGIEIVDETTLERGDLRVTVSGTGTVNPERQVILMFELPGLVSEVLVREGERVQAGAVLARLNTDELEVAVENARIALDVQQIAYDVLTQPARPEDLAAAQAAVAAAQAQLNASYATGTTAQQEEIARIQSELARNQLWQAQLQRDVAVASSGQGVPSVDVAALLPEDSGLTPEQVAQANAALNQGLSSLSALNPPVNPNQFTPGLNQAEIGVQVADANAAATLSRGANVGSVTGAEAGLVQAQEALDRLLNGATERDLQIAALGVQQAEIALDQAEAALARAIITAPFDGVIAQLNLRAGELPPSDIETPPVLLVDDSRYLVDLAIDETDVVDLAVGQDVELRLDALPDTPVRGQVVRVADVPLIVAQLVTYPVRVALDPGEAAVRLGMSATATVVVNSLDDVLMLPNRFLRIDRATQQAYVTVETENGNYTEVPVELGLRNDTQSEIVGGLDEGARVVLLPRGTFDPVAEAVN